MICRRADAAATTSPPVSRPHRDDATAPAHAAGSRPGWPVCRPGLRRRAATAAARPADTDRAPLVVPFEINDEMRRWARLKVAGRRRRPGEDAAAHATRCRRTPTACGCATARGTPEPPKRPSPPARSTACRSATCSSAWRARSAWRPTTSTSPIARSSSARTSCWSSWATSPSASTTASSSRSSSSASAPTSTIAARGGSRTGGPGAPLHQPRRRGAAVRAPRRGAVAARVGGRDRDPDLPDAWLNLGVARRRRGDLAGAEAAYKRAIDADPDYLPAYQNLSGLARLRGDDDTARQLIRLLDRRSNRNPFLLLALGDLSLEEGRLGEARSFYRRARRLQPIDAETSAALGLWAHAAGRERQARRWLARAHSTRPATTPGCGVSPRRSRADGGPAQALTRPRSPL